MVPKGLLGNQCCNLVCINCRSPGWNLLWRFDLPQLFLDFSYPWNEANVDNINKIYIQLWFRYSWDYMGILLWLAYFTYAYTPWFWRVYTKYVDPPNWNFRYTSACMYKGLVKPKEQPEGSLLPQDHPVEYQPGFLWSESFWMFWFKHCMRKHLLYILFICYIKIPLNHRKSAVRHLCWRTRLLSLHRLVRNLRLSRCRLEMGWCRDGAMVFFFPLSQIYLLKKQYTMHFCEVKLFQHAVESERQGWAHVKICKSIRATNGFGTKDLILKKYWHDPLEPWSKANQQVFSRALICPHDAFKKPFLICEGLPWQVVTPDQEWWHIA